MLYEREFEKISEQNQILRTENNFSCKRRADRLLAWLEKMQENADVKDVQGQFDRMTHVLSDDAVLKIAEIVAGHKLETFVIGLIQRNHSDWKDIE